MADANALYYYHRDGLGSVIALCDVNSAPVERYAYDVFGRPTIRDGSGTTIAESAYGNPYLFTGRAWDAETALYYYRARYYDYYTGRLLQPDPIGYGDGLNVYAYVGNNPALFTDAYGLCKGGSFWKNLWKGKYVGTGYGEFALKYYAKGYVEADGFFAKYANMAGMIFSSLWQEETWKATTLTLAGGYAADKARSTFSPLPVAPPTEQPKPPGWNEDWEYREGSRKHSGDHWWDPEGGEWRYSRAEENKPGHETPHWDYNPWDTWNGEWRNVPIAP